MDDSGDFPEDGGGAVSTSSGIAGSSDFLTTEGMTSDMGIDMHEPPEDSGDFPPDDSDFNG